MMGKELNDRMMAKFKLLTFALAALLVLTGCTGSSTTTVSRPASRSTGRITQGTTVDQPATKPLGSSATAATTQSRSTVTGPSSPDSTTDMRTLNVYLPGDSAISFYNLIVAIEEHFFEDQGVKVTPIFEKSTIGCLNRLKSDPFGIACVSPLDVLFARSSGEPVRIFFSHFVRNAYSLLIRPESPINSPDGLAGQKIGVNYLTSADSFHLKCLLSDYGMNEGKDYQIVQVENVSKAIDKLNRAEIAAYMGFISDQAMVSMKGINLRNLTPSEFSNYFSLGYIGYASDMVRKPSVYQLVAEGLVFGTEFAQRNPEKTLRHCQKYNQDETRDWRFAQALLDAVILKSTIPNVKEPMPLIYEGQMDNWRKYAARIGFPINMKDDLQATYTNEFISFKSSK